eukprot:scaffold6803_cov60-Cylindrotheca_fusiformis.AAC.1
MLLSVQDRAQYVIDAGYSMEDVADVVIEMDKIRKCRADSFATTGFGEKMQLFQHHMTKLPKGFLKAMKIGGKVKQNTIQARSA